jgi:Na+/melibiose symporter-like transporter
VYSLFTFSVAQLCLVNVRQSQPNNQTNHIINKTKPICICAKCFPILFVCFVFPYSRRPSQVFKVTYIYYICVSLSTNQLRLFVLLSSLVLIVYPNRLFVGSSRDSFGVVPAIRHAFLLSCNQNQNYDLKYSGIMKKTFLKSQARPKCDSFNAKFSQ